MVRAGEARDLDRLGNDKADEAADFVRRRVPWWIIGARRKVCARWRPVVLGLHRFFIAIARAVVNHDGGAGTSVDPMVWSVGSAHKGVGLYMRFRIKLFYQVQLVSGMGSGSLLLRFLLLAMILSFGRTLLACL